MIAQVFVPTAEFIIPTGTQTNQANAEIETQPVFVEVKISKYSTYDLFLLKDKFLVHLFF